MVIYIAVDNDGTPVVSNTSLDKLVEELDKYNGVHMGQAKRIMDQDNLNPEGYLGELDRIITYECQVDNDGDNLMTVNDEYRIYNLELNDVIQ